MTQGQSICLVSRDPQGQSLASLDKKDPVVNDGKDSLPVTLERANQSRLHRP